MGGLIFLFMCLMGILAVNKSCDDQLQRQDAIRKYEICLKNNPDKSQCK